MNRDQAEGEPVCTLRKSMIRPRAPSSVEQPLVAVAGALHLHELGPPAGGPQGAVQPAGLVGGDHLVGGPVGVEEGGQRTRGGGRGDVA